MSFIFKCSHCGADLEGEDEWRGMQTECPICKHETDIPLPAPVNDQKTNQPPRMNLGRGKTTEPSDSRSQFASPRNNPASSPGPISGPVSEAEEKECPFCGETIRDKAKVCRSCQRILPGVPAFGPIADIHRDPYSGAPGETNGTIAGMPKDVDDGKKRKKKIILISVLSVVVVAAVCVVYGLIWGAPDKTDDQGWATDEETQKPPKPVREITVTAVVSLVSLKYFKFTDSFCDIKIYAGKELVHKTSRQFSAKTKYEAKVTVPYGSILSATIKPNNQSEFKEMNWAKNVYEDLVIGVDVNSSDNYIGGLLGKHPLAAVEDGGKVYIECGKLYKE